ncbi:BatA domain-containing protein [Acidobacteria bacterium AH-259-L09]|nr:BatA domain-containing protein [Acidobacteria bacterium AH-259-L09]
MQFLAPLFWLGALAVAVPIFLHLIRREKTKRIPFASLMFIRKIPIKELRRRRLTHLFLLFLRCLGLLLLVFAFARPVITGTWLNQVNPLLARSVVILIDHSFSMSREPIWESALRAAEEKIQSLSKSDEAVIIQFGETVEVLSQWENSTGRLQQILRSRLSPSFESTSYVEGLRMAVEQLEEAQNGKREIYLITDLQQTGMGAAAGWRIPPGVFIEIEDVGSETPNLFVEESRLEREVFTDQYPHPILARVRGNPEQTVRGEAQLFVEGKLVDRQAFEVGSEGVANLTFKPFDLDQGVSRGKIVIDPSDALPADNVYYFVVEKQKPRRILVLQNRRERSEFYLQSALSSGKNLPFAVETRAPPGPSQIDPLDTPLVVLNDLRQPPKRSVFESYIQEGGGLIVVLSKNVRPEAYSQQWSALLSAQLIGRNFVRRQNKPFTSITDVNWEHPIFTIFRDVHKAGIASTQFYSYWRLSPKADASVLARFNEGDPALIEKSLGKGKILVFASSLDPIWTDFPLRSAYVPFWYRLAQYAAGWQRTPAAREINQVLPVQDSLLESVPGTSGTWNLIDPRGHRVLGLNQEDPGLIQLKIPGHYEIRSNKKTDWAAVNCRPQESDLSPVTMEDFLAVFVPREARIEEATLAEAGQDKDRQQSLWWLFLMAAAAVFVAESWVANRRGVTGKK